MLYHKKYICIFKSIIQDPHVFFKKSYSFLYAHSDDEMLDKIKM